MKAFKILSILLSLSLASTLVACGDDDGGSTVDGGGGGEAVVSVSCDGVTPAATFLTMAGTFSPTSASISVGEIVKFETSGTHDAASADGKIDVAVGATGCYRFDAAGTYPFTCTVHGFAGTLTVTE